MLTGRVVAGGEPVGGAYVRLLDGTGEFTAEVVTSAGGDFRFFAAPGTWTLRALPRSATARPVVTAEARACTTRSVTVGLIALRADVFAPRRSAAAGGGAATPARRTAGRPWQWFFTALLILASAGTVGYAAYLLRRLFTTPP